MDDSWLDSREFYPLSVRETKAYAIKGMMAEMLETWPKEALVKLCKEIAKERGPEVQAEIEAILTGSAA